MRPPRIWPRIFLSTLPARGATVHRVQGAAPRAFLSTLPARGATLCVSSRRTDLRDFYPRSPRGERPAVHNSYTMTAQFLSTLPARGATLGRAAAAINMSISIHAPREGSDVRGLQGRGQRQDFYPRSPRGERQCVCDDCCDKINISIHAPREGSDRPEQCIMAKTGQFLSTLPARGATAETQVKDALEKFLSTLPARGATTRSWRTFTPSYFYPRSPRGERPPTRRGSLTTAAFLSTLPARGATMSRPHSFAVLRIFLSTLPARGATRRWPTLPPTSSNFYPRSPRGERQYPTPDLTDETFISIHAPREGSDHGVRQSGPRQIRYFYPRSPRGERLIGPVHRGDCMKFLSTLPARGATCV